MTAHEPPVMNHKLPRSVWALGFVSLLMDTSSELIHSLLPIFMSTILGASMVTIGLIEGIAEGVAAMTKIFSGVISDRFGRRKPIVILGYGLAAISKPAFPLAPSIGWVFGGRFIDRVGKGIRGAPRDALVADITPIALRGRAYGLRQALDSVGAFVGPLLAVVFMALLMNDIRAVLWVAVVPAILAVLLLVVAVREPDDAPVSAKAKPPWSWRTAKDLPREFWLVVVVGVALTLARFSEAFLVLRADDIGLAVGAVPVVMIVMNVVYASTSYPAGAAADRIGPKTMLIAGLAILFAADLVLAFATTPILVFIGAGLWGMHMGMTQGILSKLVADASPAPLRGTAFGVFNFLSGGALIVASVVAGALWSSLGASATFLAGSGFVSIAAVLLGAGGVVGHRDAS